MPTMSATLATLNLRRSSGAGRLGEFLRGIAAVRLPERCARGLPGARPRRHAQHSQQGVEALPYGPSRATAL